MGSGLGQIPGIGQRLIVPSQPGGAALDAPSVEPDLLQGSLPNAATPNSARPFFQELPAPDPPGAGFGEGTVSGPAAALDALGRGVSVAREAVPSLEDIRAQFQAARIEDAQNRDVVNEALRDRLNERRATLESRIPEADPQGLSAFNRALAFSENEPLEPPEPAVEPAANAEAAAAGGPETEFEALEAPAPAEPAADVFDRVGRDRLDVTG